MQIKKFRANTGKEAIANVKSALGLDAMIIASRKISQGNNKTLFEITAMPAGYEIAAEESDPLNEVKSELMSIKEMICLQDHSGGVLENLVTNPALLNLYIRLIRNGVNRHNAKFFLEQAGAFNGHAADAQTITKKAVTEILKPIRFQDPFAAAADKQIVAALIGTTGVGKTTTIAKLAARLLLKRRKKVGLISIDTYRIGAMEQLKTYANILGIPFCQAFKSKDLHFAARRMADKDVVLIDTAGQSQYDRTRIKELTRMLKGGPEITSHLLLSVATTEPEMHKTAANFGPLKFQSYIFTKLDEAQRSGSIINQILKVNIPISYLTTGQNVPEDIERANKKTILKQLLN